MKIMMGVVGVLIVALLIAAIVISRGDKKLAITQSELAGVTAALSRAENENRQLTHRLDALDKTLGQLGDSLNANQAELETRLDTIRNMTPEVNDDPKSFECLDMRIPDSLDNGLR